MRRKPDFGPHRLSNSYILILTTMKESRSLFSFYPFVKIFNVFAQSNSSISSFKYKNLRNPKFNKHTRRLLWLWTIETLFPVKGQIYSLNKRGGVCRFLLAMMIPAGTEKTEITMYLSAS